MKANRIRGHAGQRIREAFLSSHPTCALCSKRGVTRLAAQVDHIVPLFRGGLDVDANKQALCLPCHNAKSLAERGLAPRGCTADGTPRDDAHAWNATGDGVGGRMSGAVVVNTVGESFNDRKPTEPANDPAHDPEPERA